MSQSPFVRDPMSVQEKSNCQASNEEPSFSFFREVPRTGVIYVMKRAREMGYKTGCDDWCNLGRGAPDLNPIPNQPERNLSLDCSKPAYYAPTNGEPELRQAIADMYNNLHRQGKQSKYTIDNVCVVPGGRAGLNRIMNCFGKINVGHLLPEYTAYENLLGMFDHVCGIPVLSDHQNPFNAPVEQLDREIHTYGLSAMLFSNPHNPMGYLLEDEKILEWVNVARKNECLMIFDELFGHYLYNHDQSKDGKLVSAAASIDDVNLDPILIMDGLTKNWRLPGWRICWIVGPKSLISTITAAGSFTDGGANYLLQKEAIPLLSDPDWVRADIAALQAEYRAKRDYVTKELARMGIFVDGAPEGTFYLWADISHLPSPLNDCDEFFESALRYKVITVAGTWFDVNPGGRRHGSRQFRNRMRLSFGPHMNELKLALSRIEKMIVSASLEKKFSPSASCIVDNTIEKMSTSKSLAEMDLLDNMMENIHTSSPPEKKHLDHDFDTDNEADESSRVYGGRVLRIHDVPIVGPQF